MKKPHALILGGTSGLGRDIAIQCLHDGVVPIVMGRNIKAVQKDNALHGALTFGVDLTNPRLSVADKYHRFEQLIHDCRITHIFWTAGVQQKRSFLKMSASEILEQVGVHFSGPLLILNRILPHLISRGDPIHLVTISSAIITKRQGGIEVYAPLKRAKLEFSREMSESLTEQLPGSLVTVVLPGAMATSFRADLDRAEHSFLMDSMVVARIISAQTGLAHGPSYRPMSQLGPFVVVSIEAANENTDHINVHYLLPGHVH